jgi:hypothetical protein
MWSLKKALVVFAGLCWAVVLGLAHADTVDTTVATLLSGHADPRDGQLHTVVPVYESLSILATVKRPFTDGIRIVFSGWGGMLWEVPSSVNFTGDIDVGYVEGNFFRQRLQIRLGRQLILGGAARNAQIDGLDVSARLYQGFGLAGYVGVPVTPRFGVHRGDFIFGGRMFYRYSLDTEFGISFNEILNAGQVARQDLAVDARYVPYRTVAISAYALVAIPEARLAEANVAVTWLPRVYAQVSLDYMRTAPDLFLPLNSVFAVFAQETRDEAGGWIYLRPVKRLRFYGDYHVLVQEEGVGHRGSGKLTLSLGRNDHTTLNAEVRLLMLPTSGYVQGRVYSIHHLSPAFLATLGLDTYCLEHPINGQSYSFTANSTVGYDFGKGFRLVLSGMADVTPFVERRFEFVTRLAYNAVRRFHEVQP